MFNQEFLNRVMNKLVLIGLNILFAFTVAAKQLDIKDSVGIVNINGKPFIRHMVIPGETIYGISSKYKVAVTDLLELNPQLENGLKVGQEISIPYDPKLNLNQNSKIEEEGKTFHIVEAGETFYSLARKYNISVGELLKMNDIELKVGQKVVVTQKKSIVEEPIKVNTSSVSTPIVNSEVVDNKIIVKNEPENRLAQVTSDTIKNSPYFNTIKRILVIPFDPYLYFSDADEEIAAMSKLERTRVRQAFRKRLNALLEPSGYETIHLLGGRIKDSLTDLNKVYSSVSYSYQDLLYNPNAQAVRTLNEGGQLKEANKDTKAANGDPMNTSRASLAKDQNKYFGVKIKDPNFFNYFNNKYKIDYYIFVNQFEVKTNYETCLDRARQNYERNFVTHFSIFDSKGNQIAGNRIKINYESNENRIQKILTDNMQKVADKIIGELPAAK